MLSEEEKRYLDSLVRPEENQLPNGSREYFFNEHKYSRQIDAEAQRKIIFCRLEKRLKSRITEDLVREAEVEFNEQSARDITFVGPLLPPENEDPVRHVANDNADRARVRPEFDPVSIDTSALRKIFSLILVSAGAFAMLYGAGMDTSVDAGAIGRVHNLDLANQQRNILLVGAVAVMAGLVLLVMANQKSDNAETRGGEKNRGEEPKKCPACAEFIKKEAKLCRYCGTKQE